MATLGAAALTILLATIGAFVLVFVIQLAATWQFRRRSLVTPPDGLRESVRRAERDQETED